MTSLSLSCVHFTGAFTPSSITSCTTIALTAKVWTVNCRLFDGTGGSPTIIVAGISSNGTEAAGAFSVSPASLAELARHAPRGWENMNFEAVLKAQVVQGHLGAVQLAATQIWPRSSETKALQVTSITDRK